MLNTFLSIHETEGIPLNIVEDHVGQAVWEVYGLNYGTDEPWEMTDKISEAIEQCYDIGDWYNEPELEAAEARVADIQTTDDFLRSINTILDW